MASTTPRASTPTRTATPVRRSDSTKADHLSEAKRLGESRNVALQTIRILGKVGDDRYEVDSANILSTLKENEQNVFTPIPQSLTTMASPGPKEAGAVGSEKTRSLTPSRFVLPEFQSVQSGLKTYILSSPSKGKTVIPIKTLHVDVNEPLPLAFDPRHDPHVPNKEIQRVNSRYTAFFQRIPSGSKPAPAKALCPEKVFNLPDEENPRKQLEERKLQEAMLRIAVTKKAPPKPVIDSAAAPKAPIKVSKSFVPTCANCDLSRRLQIVEEERRARLARQEKMLKNRPKSTASDRASA